MMELFCKRSLGSSAILCFCQNTFIVDISQGPKSPLNVICLPKVKLIIEKKMEKLSEKTCLIKLKFNKIAILMNSKLKMKTSTKIILK